MGDMYAPRPPRPKKTNIVRSRTGCYTCRRRRIKCDETKPECRYCLRLGIKCEGFAPRYSFLDTTAATRMRVNKTESQSTVPPQERPRSGVEDTSHVTTPDVHDEIRGQRAHHAPVGLPPIAALLPPRVRPIPHSPEAARNQLEAWDETSTTFETPSSTQTWSQNSTPSTPSAAADRVAIVPAALPSDSPTYLARVRTPSPHDSAYMSTLPDFPFHAKRYMAHFLSYVCRLLPPAFLELKNLAFDFPVLRDAAIALAASNLAHLQASAQRLTTDGRNKVVALPDYGHMSHGLKFYEQAVKKLSIRLTEDSHSLGLMLAASLLLAEFEFESGTPKAYFTHIEGANALVASKHVSISRTPLGQQILASWASIQNRCSFSKLPFRSLDVESGSYQTVFITLDIRHLKQRYASREAQVLNCLVDCHRIHTRVVLECCMRNGAEDASETMRRSVAWYSQKFNYPYAKDNDSRPDRRVVPGDVLIHTLADQRMRLDAWHDTLSIDELPIESFKAQDLEDQNHRFADGSLFIRPIEFRSNAAALTYMYYAFAQFLSSGQALRELNSPIHPSESQQPRVISPWVILILRIALGMVGSKTWAIEETTYRVGLLRILFEVALCCPDERPITYIIDTLLSRMKAAANCPTSSINLTKWKKWLIVLLDQLKVGKEIYSLVSKHPPNTEVLAPDSDANNEEWIAIHGRSRGGSFFNDLIRVS